MKVIKLCTLCLILILSGCATPVLHVPPTPLTGDFEGDKIDLSVELRLSENFTNYVIRTHRKAYVVGNYHYSIGDSLNSAAIEMAEEIFENVQVSQGGSSEASSKADAVLVPRIIPGQTVFIFDNKGYPAKLVFEITDIWNLYTPDMKELLYTTRITGNGKKDSFTIFAQKSKLTEALHKTINDLMVKSYQDLYNSWKIRKYAIIPSIILASPENRVIIAQRLLDSETNITRRNKLGLTALYHAIDIDDMDLATGVLKMGIDPNGYNSYKIGPPINVAAMEGKINFVDLMIGYGADINAKDKDGWTCLFYFTRKNNKEAMRYLIGKGAEVHPIGDTAHNSYATAMSYLASAQYNEELGNRDKVIEHYTGAAKYFEKASLQYKELHKETSKLKMKQDLKNFARIFFAGIAQASAEISTQLAAEQNQRQINQILAMKTASKTGTGYSGYYKEMKSYERNRKPIKTDFRFAEPILIDTTNLKELKMIFADLSEKSRQYSVEMRHILECYKSSGSKEKMVKCNETGNTSRGNAEVESEPQFK